MQAASAIACGEPRSLFFLLILVVFFGGEVLPEEETFLGLQPLGSPMRLGLR